MAIILHYAVPLSILHNGQLRLIEKKLYSRTRGRIERYRTRLTITRCLESSRSAAFHDKFKRDGFTMTKFWGGTSQISTK